MPLHLGHHPTHPGGHPRPGGHVGEGVRDFLFDAFLHIARHERPPLATPDSECPPLLGDRVWVPPIN